MTAMRSTEATRSNDDVRTPEAKKSKANTRSNELHEIVERASAVIAHYWPMTTFVHHNPIRGLETMRFQEAVKTGQRFVGGRGYLPNGQYRRLLQSGRIKPEHLDAALSSVARDEELVLGGRRITHLDVLRAHLLIGITAPAEESIPALINRKTMSTIPKIEAGDIHELARRLTYEAALPDAGGNLGREITLLSWCDQALNTQLEWLVNRELIKWLEAFLDEGHAAWPMPYRERGFYEAWRSLAALEWSPCGISNMARKIGALPASPAEAVLAHLDMLAVPPSIRQDYLSLALTSLSGWASFINWRCEHSTYAWQAAYPIDLVQYLAVRLFYERELVDKACREELGIEGKLSAIASHVRDRQRLDSTAAQGDCLAPAWRLGMLGGALQISAQELKAIEADKLKRLLYWLDEFPESEHGSVWLEAYEAGYQEKLIRELNLAITKAGTEDRQASRPLAQAMFCIDVRSEPFRRNLESIGHYETIGFAGFFGIPMRCRALNQHHETDQLPAIVEPKYTVHEIVREDQQKRFRRHNLGAGIIHTIQEMLHDMKSHVLTPYVMVESLGWLFGVQLFGRTLFPSGYRKLRARMRKTVAPPVGTTMDAERSEAGLGLTLEEQCATVETVLRTMGLIKNFARLVVVCGHTSTSDNNPYEAALSCGACGGNSGKPNARLLAGMANKPQVRQHLASNGIVIPEDTHFMGAVHDTTTDGIELFDLEDLPDTHRSDFERLKADLREAAVKTNHERCIRLPGADNNPSPAIAAKEVARRAGDWSETRPEWGLAGNAAFIIGHRQLTRNINLEGRAFLNSHDYRIDPSGALLEGIMMGPMVVGQWINAEHYFSATDTEVYGSGSKIYHNVVGRIGIMSGPQSDLRTGLAWQSMMNGELPYHEPLRLFVAIEAPRKRIHEIIARQPVLKQLCDNEWIHLMAIDHESENKLYRYRPVKGWEAVPLPATDSSKTIPTARQDSSTGHSCSTA